MTKGWIPLVALILACTGACTGSIGDPGHSVGPGDGPGGARQGGSAEPADPKALGVRVVQLHPAQYQRGVDALLPNAPDVHSTLIELFDAQDRLSSPANLNETVVNVLLANAGQVGFAMAEQPALIGPCVAEGLPADDVAADVCLREDFRPLLRRAWRRPPSEDELDRVVAMVGDARAAGVSSTDALADVMQGILLAPSFLIRSELGPKNEASDGTGETTLDAYERAAALSFLLKGAPPSDALLDAADEGALQSAEGLREMARSMLEDAGQAHGILDFIAEYSGTARLENVAILEWEPAFTTEMRRDMAQEPRHFAAHVLTNDDARFETLMSAPYSVLSPRLAELYGVDGAGDGWSMTALPTRERAGLVTMAGVVAAHSDPSSTVATPILRGHYVRSHFLCDPPAAPPPIDSPPTRHKAMSPRAANLSMSSREAERALAATG